MNNYQQQQKINNRWDLELAIWEVLSREGSSLLHVTWVEVAWPGTGRVTFKMLSSHDLQAFLPTCSVVAEIQEWASQDSQVV